MQNLRLLAFATLLLLLPPPVQAEEQAPSRWRGSEITFRNTASLLSVKKDAELSYNPYYAMWLGAGLRGWFSKTVYGGVDLGVTRELTDADDTTMSGEYLLDDIEISVGAARFYTIPKADISLTAAATLITPTSKLADSQSLIVGVRPMLKLGRKFDLLRGLSLGYTATATKFFNSYTTAQRDAPLIPGCSSADGFCDSFVHMGDRNPQWRIGNQIAATIDFTDWLGASISGAVVVDFLYQQETTAPEVSFEPTPGTNLRHSVAYGAEVYGLPLKWLSIALGIVTANPQLAPDSTYEKPFLNRYSTVYLDLRLDIGELSSK